MGEGCTGIGGGCSRAVARGHRSRWSQRQSAAHLVLMLGQRRVGTVARPRALQQPCPISSRRSSRARRGGGPSPCPRRERGRRRSLSRHTRQSRSRSSCWPIVTHDGPHHLECRVASVIGLVVAVGVLLASRCSRPADGGPGPGRSSPCSSLCGSFLVTALDQLDAGRFERSRGDPIAEYQIVAKEGLELLGWSLVALALWDEALRRRSRSRREPATARASRARAASRRRAA